MTRMFSLAVALMAATPALSQSETVTIETARGPAEVPADPETIAVYDISSIDILDALGVVPDGVPDTIGVDYLAPEVGEAEVVGTLFEPDFEALNALQPDLIIVGGRSGEQLDAVSDIAPAIDMSIWGDDLIGQAQDRLEAFGTLFGREDEAAAIAEEFQATIEEARAAAEGKGDALIVLTNGPKISAYGANSRFGWIHAATGLPEAAADLDTSATSTHGEAVGFEFIREADPDWLIAIDRVAAIGAGGERAEQTLDNQLVAETTAWQKDQVIYVNPANAYVAGGGIQSMSQVLEALTERLNAAGS